MKLANLLPPLFVLIIITTIESTYVLLHLIPLFRRDHEDEQRGIIHTAISQTLVLLLFTCYALCIFTPPGWVPEGVEWDLGNRDHMDQPETHEMKTTGERRYCKWCFKYKPDRCHHCRICRRCVLKMDHHCPWIMNCVGFENHKYFFLLVVYSMLSCWFITFTVTESVERSAESEDSMINRFLLVLCLTLAIIMGSLMTVFLSFHVWLMLSGMTTIEFCEKATSLNRSTQGYSQGFYGNLTAVLGPQPLLWFMPVALPDGSGTMFPTVAHKSLKEGSLEQKI